MGQNLIMVLLLTAVHTASGWTNGQLLIWMDSDRARAMRVVADRFEKDFAIPVRIETPEKITANFSIATQAGKGPDIVIWAHDKVGEWADGGIIAPIEVTAAYKQQFYPMAWDAVRHRRQLWGYPISLEAAHQKKAVKDGPLSGSDDARRNCPGIECGDSWYSGYPLSGYYSFFHCGGRVDATF
jgi:maltose/maltodextrin transport system substrate-binding protein